MRNPINVAVVGVGYLGRIHAKIYHGLDGVNLIGVVDTDPAVVKEVADQYQCPGFDSVDALLNREQGNALDAVSIVVPTSLHCSVATPFLQRGVHMLLEKPIAPTVQESEDIVAIAGQHRTILQIGHLERFNAGVMKLAELAKKSEIYRSASSG